MIYRNKPAHYKSIRATYAYRYSNCDKDFVLTINAECGSWNCDIHQLKYYRDGQYWSDGYLCGVSAYYNTKEFIKIKKAHKANNWQEEVKICYELYRRGVRFYGYNHRHKRGVGFLFLN